MKKAAARWSCSLLRIYICVGVSRLGRRSGPVLGLQLREIGAADGRQVRRDLRRLREHRIGRLAASQIGQLRNCRHTVRGATRIFTGEARTFELFAFSNASLQV